MSTEIQNKNDIKKQKGDYWSRPGAGEIYEKGVSSIAGVIQIKNLVERAIVVKNAHGLILDAGTGSGRFAIPLARDPGNSVVALDYSNEMLEQNKKLSAQQGVNTIKYVQGDIEHLTFPDDHFDAVVSITVVRHFPQWQNILKEYVRVLKPGGKVVFEMCSADHIQMANRISPRFGFEHSDGSFVNYEAEVSYDDLSACLDSMGIDIEERITYDFFNSNCFIKLLTINKLGYRIFNKVFNLIFCIFPLPNLMAWLELNVLRYLPPAFSYNYMVVCRKR
ncbi:MAG TPA: class I SAM-dependent methyltransferase [Gallionella sp.]|nr:class I SAM-dependent methyltransferase [Gallionella sp.]